MKSAELQNQRPASTGNQDMAGTGTRIPQSLEFMFPLILVVLTLIPYWQTASFGFVNFDDPIYVYENPLLRDGLTLPKIHEAIVQFRASNWHPLVWLSFMAEIELFGMTPGVMHLTNVVLHIANALLIYLWLRRSTGEAVRSFIAAFIFAAHPLHVESVAWITERKDVLSTLFMMATLISYSEFAQRNNRKWYFASLLFFAIGLTAKGMLVTVPVVLLLLDVWPLRRLQLSNSGAVDRAFLRGIAAEKIPFVVLSIAVAGVTILAQHSDGAVASITALPFYDRAANSIVAFSRYLLKTVWPIDLGIYYPIPLAGWPGGMVVASAMSFAAFTWMAWWNRKRRIATMVGWCWFVVTLLPVIGIIQVGSQSLADRYMYVPMIGLSLFLWSLPDQWMEKKMLVVPGVVLAVIALTLTARQVNTWRDSIALFEHALQVEPDNNVVARMNLGIAYTDAGRFEDAEVQLVEELKLRPGNLDCLLNLGRNYNRTGQFEKTEFLLGSAIPLHLKNPQLLLHFGNAMRGQGKAESAIESYRAAIDLKPDFSEALNNLGLVLCRTNNDEGMTFIRRAIEADSRNAQAHNSLGNALVRAGDLQAAEQSYLEAIKLADLKESKQNLAYVRKLLGPSRKQK